MVLLTQALEDADGETDTSSSARESRVTTADEKPASGSNPGSGGMSAGGSEAKEASTAAPMEVDEHEGEEEPKEDVEGEENAEKTGPASGGGSSNTAIAGQASLGVRSRSSSSSVPPSGRVGRMDSSASSLVEEEATSVAGNPGDGRSGRAPTEENPLVLDLPDDHVQMVSGTRGRWRVTQLRVVVVHDPDGTACVEPLRTVWCRHKIS